MSPPLEHTCEPVWLSPQSRIEDLRHERPDCRFRRCAWPRDIEHLDIVLTEEAQQRGTRLGRAGVEMQVRFVVLLGHLPGELCSCNQVGRQREDDGAVSIPDVPFRPLGIVRRRCFLQPIAISNPPIFRPAPMGTPTTMGDSMLQSLVQRGAVYSCLAT